MADPTAKIVQGSATGTPQPTILTDASGNQQGTPTSAISTSPLSVTTQNDGFAGGPNLWIVPGATTGIAAMQPYLQNGNQSDRERNNVIATLLSSAARTTSQTTADQTNYNGLGARLRLNVTVASGTGGLTLSVQEKDNASGVYTTIFTAPAAVIATGMSIYDIYPGAPAAAAPVTGSLNGRLPRLWRVTITAGDGSSYTYSVSLDNWSR